MHFFVQNTPETTGIQHTLGEITVLFQIQVDLRSTAPGYGMGEMEKRKVGKKDGGKEGKKRTGEWKVILNYPQ